MSIFIFGFLYLSNEQQLVSKEKTVPDAKLIQMSLRNNE